MNRLAKRVHVLEARAPLGCETCRWWDGTIVECRFGERSRPDQCPECGRVVLPHLIVQIDGVDWDLV